MVLVVGNGGSVDPALVTLPAAKALHAADVPLVVASVWEEVTNGPARADAVQPIRDDELAKTVSTVDDLDLAEGPATVVLALSDLFLPKPVVGHYGYGDGTQPLPDPPATVGTSERQEARGAGGRGCARGRGRRGRRAGRTVRPGPRARRRRSRDAC